MSTRNSTIGPVFVMQILVAVYLVTLGIAGVSAYNGGSEVGRSLAQIFGTGQSSFDLIVAIAEIVAGVIIFLGLFPVVTNQLIYFSAIVIAILWVVWIIVSYFFQGERITLGWFNGLALNLIVAAAIWLVATRHR